MSNIIDVNGVSPSIVCDYKNRPPPPPFPHGYPQPCIDDELLLRCFPDPWLRICNLTFNSPPVRTLGNLNLIDVSTHIIDDIDPSKRFKFQVENVTTGTTREITIPDEDFTLITQTSADTLTNKTIVGLSNMVGATQFETSGAPVLITSTAPPGAGYSLVTTSTGVATWQLTGAGATGRIAYTLNNGKFSAVSSSFIPISSFSWFQARYAGYTSGIVIFHVTIADRNLDIQMRNVTGALILGSSLNISASGIYSFPITLPTANSTLEIEIRKTLGGGTSPIINGISLEFDQ